MSALPEKTSKWCGHLAFQRQDLSGKNERTRKAVWMQSSVQVSVAVRVDVSFQVFAPTGV